MIGNRSGLRQDAFKVLDALRWMAFVAQRVSFLKWNGTQAGHPLHSCTELLVLCWFSLSTHSSFLVQRSYVVYPPEGPRPPSPEELREMAREMRKNNPRWCRLLQCSRRHNMFMVTLILIQVLCRLVGPLNMVWCAWNKWGDKCSAMFHITLAVFVHGK